MKDKQWFEDMKRFGVFMQPAPDGENYELLEPIKYFSRRYKKWITVPVGIYDGATGAIDIVSLSWPVHDGICKHPYFDDGTPITAWQAATILSDILWDEGRYIRQFRWRFWTFTVGCVKARDNGWF